MAVLFGCVFSVMESIQGGNWKGKQQKQEMISEKLFEWNHNVLLFCKIILCLHKEHNTWELPCVSCKCYPLDSFHQFLVAIWNIFNSVNIDLSVIRFSPSGSRYPAIIYCRETKKCSQIVILYLWHYIFKPFQNNKNS